MGKINKEQRLKGLDNFAQWDRYVQAALGKEGLIAMYLI
jgi:hypothetical protein